MIGLDTNVLVRYLAQDDPVQSPQASLLMESLTPAQPGFINLVVLVETVWVLTSPRYGVGRDQLCQVVEGLLRTKELAVAEAETVWRALRLFQSGNGGFADCLTACGNQAAGCERTVTFDRAAIKACGMVAVG